VQGVFLAQIAEASVLAHEIFAALFAAIDPVKVVRQADVVDVRVRQKQDFFPPVKARDLPPQPGKRFLPEAGQPAVHCDQRPARVQDADVAAAGRLQQQRLHARSRSLYFVTRGRYASPRHASSFSANLPM
jgi:hypothetical protein